MSRNDGSTRLSCRALTTMFCAFILDHQKHEKDNMKSASKKFTAVVATLSTLALSVRAAPTAYADDYCITNGAQAAHGCGYPSMETCREASSGIGGICARNPWSAGPSNALDYQPKRAHSRAKHRLEKKSSGSDIPAHMMSASFRNRLKCCIGAKGLSRIKQTCSIIGLSNRV